MINDTFRANIEQEQDKNFIEINSIMNTVTFNTNEVENIAKSYYLNNTYFLIYMGNATMFSNFKELDDHTNSIAKNLFANPGENLITYIEDEKIYTLLRKYNYTVFMQSSLSHIYKNKAIQIESFIKTSIIASLLVALILSISVHFMTKKIKKLLNVVREMEDGHYDVKIPNLGTDEIGEFATAFEKMATSIDYNVRKIKEESENRKIFIGNLAHEIRTPLTSIIGYSSLIKNKKITDPTTINEYCNKIHEEGNYIEAMRDKLMNIMSLETNAIELKEIDISSCIETFASDLKKHYPSAKIILNLEKRVYKLADKDLLRSIVLNLFKNAYNASEKPIIKITLTKDELQIIDNGKGIPQKELKKITEPFYTLNKDRNRKHSGMGLGLPLVFKIVEIHGWTMTINSKENEGTVITISLGGIQNEN